MVFARANTEYFTANSDVKEEKLQWGRPKHRQEFWGIPRARQSSEGCPEQYRDQNTRIEVLTALIFRHIIRFHTFSAVLYIVYLLFMLCYVMLCYVNVTTDILVGKRSHGIKLFMRREAACTCAMIGCGVLRLTVKWQRATGRE